MDERPGLPHSMTLLRDLRYEASSLLPRWAPSVTRSPLGDVLVHCGNTLLGRRPFNLFFLDETSASASGGQALKPGQELADCLTSLGPGRAEL